MLIQRRARIATGFRPANSVELCVRSRGVARVSHFAKFNAFALARRILDVELNSPCYFLLFVKFPAENICNKSDDRARVVSADQEIAVSRAAEKNARGMNVREIALLHR